jgi:hypothetical protein
VIALDSRSAAGPDPDVARERVIARRWLIVLPATLVAIIWICGVTATIISSQIIFEKLQSLSWPEVPATVTKVLVNPETKGTPYVSYVEGAFAVGGKRYRVQEDMERTGYSLSASALVVAMDRAISLVFCIPALAILFLLTRWPSLKRKSV